VDTLLNKLKYLTSKIDSHGLEAETVNSMFIYIAEDATDGYFDWMVGSEAEYLSDSFKRQLGYEPDELPNLVESWSKLLHEDDKDRLHEELTKHFESKGSYPFQVVSKYKHKNGDWIDILCRGKVIEWDGAKPVRFVGIHIKL
jgi:PAS domain S-box-containing protein